MPYKRKSFLRHLLSFPFIYGMVFPMVLLDITAEIYHQICFRLYGIPRIQRSKYIKIDRHKLKYLNLLDKANCMYCGYANGLVNYLVQVAGETEKYWCAIKHKQTKNFKEPKHHKSFAKYGDKKAFCKLQKKTT